MNRRAACIELTASPEVVLNEAQWRQVAELYLFGMEYWECLWLYALEPSERVLHAVTCRIRFDRTVVEDSWDGPRSEGVLRHIRQHMGLT